MKKSKQKKNNPEWLRAAKLSAVSEALKLVNRPLTLGLGSGTTVELAIPRLARLMRRNKLRVRVVPTSRRIERLARTQGLRTVPLTAEPIDLAIDGADQIQERTLAMIKGRGGALVREKVVDKHARRVAIVVDETKMSGVLDRPVPVEVVPFAAILVKSQLRSLNASARIRLSERDGKPAVTDNGNFLIDANFGPISRPTRLEERLRCIPGVVETGIFVDVADKVFVGTREGTAFVLTRSD